MGSGASHLQLCCAKYTLQYQKWAPDGDLRVKRAGLRAIGLIAFLCYNILVERFYANMGNCFAVATVAITKTVLKFIFF